MKKKIIFTVMIMLCCAISFGQVKNSTKKTKRINTYLTELEKVGFSGTVLVEINGNKVISKGYGFSDKENSIKNDPTIIFSTGSITKQFTATAILKLEMQDKLSTADKISKYFENLPKDKENITIHDLLRHQSGLKSNVGSDFDKISQIEFIDKVMSSSLLFESGTRFSYSNIGYSLLAIIIEKVSGTTYENYLYKNLWKPAEMETTGYSRPNFNINKIAIGYYRDGKVWGKSNDKNWDIDAPYWHLKGNGGVFSTTEDMYKWHKALQGEQVLSTEAKKKLYHPKIRTEENYNTIYAYGWDVSQTNRKTNRVWHNGTNNIFYADFMRYIDEGVTLIMLSNKSHQTNFDQLNFELSKMIFDKNYKPIIPIADNEVNQKYSQNLIEIISSQGLEAGKESYNKRPANINMLEYILNAKGYEFLAQKNYDKAIKLFIMNIFAFPKSANAFDSLGEAYMNKSDKNLAIKHYEKSLELNSNNGNAKDMLLELRK
ncbi:serine hydrolase [Flavobacterium sp.]|uniref:serine hydrolase n=1 Tax=Flavobacterium sp. TaxID=239 RepID=UPI00286C3340|nr:serine hydrolase [Flavobacterium sp.]